MSLSSEKGAASANASKVPVAAMLWAARMKAPHATRARAEPTETRRTPRSASRESESTLLGDGGDLAGIRVVHGGNAKVKRALRRALFWGAVVISRLVLPLLSSLDCARDDKKWIDDQASPVLVEECVRKLFSVWSRRWS